MRCNVTWGVSVRDATRRIVVGFCLGALVLPFVLPLAVLRAQQPSSAPRNDSSVSPLSVSATFPRPTDSLHAERYGIPDFCLATIYQAVDSVRWGFSGDTMPLPDHDTLPTIAQQRARACFARFPIASQPTINLSSLVVLGLAVHDDSVVLRAFEQVVRAPKTAEQRFNEFSQLSSAVTDPGPFQNLPLARTIAAHVAEWVGEPPFGAQAAGMMYSAIVANAIQRLDWAALREATAQLSVLSRQMQSPLGDVGALYELYDVRFNAGTDSARHFYDHQIPARMAAAWPAVHEYVDSRFGLIGRPAPAIAPVFRMPPSAQVSVPDSVTLVTFVDANCGASCYGDYWLLRRLRAHAPALRLVLLSEIGGHVRDVTGSMADRAAQLDRYFADSLRLSSIVLADTMAWQARAEPDGRRVYGRSPAVAAYYPLVTRPETGPWFRDGLQLGTYVDPGLNGRVTLIGRDGRVAWDAPLARSDERFLTGLIDRLINGTDANTGPPRVGPS